MHVKAVVLTGNEATALAMRQINPDVVAAYPITPSTDIVQYFSSFVADGAVDSQFVAVESEHSAMSATIGASAAGGRAMTATSSQGLALMWEMLYMASGFRVPVVMPVVNRALSAPLNIHGDHSDTMGARDSGWIQLYSENVQEAYDNLIQAVRIAEHPDVRLPVMVCQDGFVVSHAMENLEILDDRSVREFVGPFRPESSLLDPDRPAAYGAMALPNSYFEHRRGLAEAMRGVIPIILETAREYETLSGRSYGLFEEYRLDDAEIAVMVLSSAAGTAKDAVDQLRAEGLKAGLLKLRVFRPFPAEELARAMGHLRALAVLDRADSLNGVGGPVFSETRNALYGLASDGRAPKIVNFIYGLGGRDIGMEHFREVFEDLADLAEGAPAPLQAGYLGVNEEDLNRLRDARRLESGMVVS